MNAVKDLMTAGAAVLIAGLVALAGSQHGAATAGIPIVLLCTGAAFLMQWLVFVHAWRNKTEQYFDLTGSLTYLALLGLALALGSSDPRALLIAALIAIWAARLGTFLFRRVRTDGSDRRFDRIRHSFSTFFMTWTLQGLWVSLTLACALAAMTTIEPEPLGVFAVSGVMIWLGGFALEVVADRQKSDFRSQPENQHRFIQTGLWAWSRHPNYFGEIVLWVGVALIALPVLKGWQWVTLVSPVFVYVLLTRISGIGMLEARADRAWGEEPEYQAYKGRTPLLIPRRPV